MVTGRRPILKSSPPDGASGASSSSHCIPTRRPPHLPAFTPATCYHAPMSPGQFHTWLRRDAREPLIMGVLNVTPDSFSDGGAYVDVAGALAHGVEMLAQGAD